jgi:hypothetical protein
MNIRSFAFAFAASSMLATAAGAHEPGQFDALTPAPLPMPTTCDELADTDNYSSDETDERIKVLKQRCDERKDAPADGTEAKAGDEEAPVSKDDE